MTTTDEIVPAESRGGAEAPVGAPAERRASRGVEATGEMVQFFGQVFRGLPDSIRLYPSEIFRHAGLLIRDNAAVVLFMIFMFGAVMTLTVSYLYASLGIESYIALVSALAMLRGIGEVVFGWIIAAKVGCGIAAEIGSMKISDEIDAMEVMGIRSVSYLASTRLAAGLMVFPLLWITALAVNFIGSYLFATVLSDTVSEGGFIYILFLFQNPKDFFFSVAWGTLVALIIILVASYFGFAAKGGPVGVGRNTAMSMLVNLVLISFTAVVLVQLFYGNDPNIPIAN